MTTVDSHARYHRPTAPAGRFARLSAADLVNLAVETPDTPMQIGALLVLDGAALCDPEGRLRLAELRARIGQRLAAVPRLGQVIRPAGPLGGRPVWVDAPLPRLEWHVNAIALPDAADPDDALLRLTARLLVSPLDHAQPLWRMWFVTGLPAGRVGLVVVVHHVLADGMATVQMLGALLDGPPVPPAPPVPAPRWAELVRDNLRSRLAAGHRYRPHRVALRGLGRGLADAWHAPRTSLNAAPVGPRRRIAVLRLDLTQARRVARAHRATINDLVLDLAAGGLRALLHTRGEPVAGRYLHTAVAVSLRGADPTNRTGNVTGGLVVRLPVGEPDPGVRLGQIAAETARAKRGQSAAGGTAILVWLGRLGLLRYLARRQHMTNVHESDLTGPAQPIRVLDAPVLDLVPVGLLSGNVGVAFLAFSYAGRLRLTVLADADRFPDLPVLTAAIEREWETLTAGASTPVTR